MYNCGEEKMVKKINKDNKNSKKEIKSKIGKKKSDEDEDNDAEDEAESDDEMDNNVDVAEDEVKKLGAVLGQETGDEIDKVNIKASKPVTQLKKGDKVKVDGVELEVDAHYVLIEHGETKEMTIELFNPKTDKDYQLRYFSGQLETSMEFYELQEILYVRRPCIKVEW